MPSYGARGRADNEKGRHDRGARAAVAPVRAACVEQPGKGGAGSCRAVIATEGSAQFGLVRLASPSVGWAVETLTPRRISIAACSALSSFGSGGT